MATFWGLIIPVSSYFSFPLLAGLVIWGTWVLYSRKSQKQVTTTKDSETSRQHKLKKIRKFTAPESEENFRMECIAASLAHFSDIPAGRTQEFIFWSMNRSLKHIFQHLENARSNLVKLSLPEQQCMISSTSSIIVTQEAVLPLCVCKKAQHTNQDTTRSSHISSLSKFSVISEGTTWKFQSHSLPVFRKKPKKRTSRSRKQRSSLHSLYFPEIRKPKFLQNLEVLSPDKIQGTLINSIIEYPEICRQKKKTQAKKKVTADDRQYSTFKKASKSPEWVLSRFWWELERHMAWKVCTLKEQTVPLPVRESRAMMNDLTKAQGGISEPKRPQIQLSMSKYQSSEKNIKNKSPHLPSFLPHVNTEVESGLNRMETKTLQSLMPGKQSQPKGDSQILGYRSSVESMNIPPAKRFVVVRNQEATTFLQKDPKHVLELRLEQRVIGFPEKRTQHHKTEVTKVELTPRLPYQFRDNIKVTPLELLQVMDSMGMIPESHSEVIESMGLFPQSPNQAAKPVEAIQTASIKHKLFQDTESVVITSKPTYQGIDSERISRSPNLADNVRITPVELLRVMDSMGMIKKPHPNNTETTVTPRPQYQVKESLNKDTQFDHQIKQPVKESLKPQYLSTKTVEMTPRQQNKIESVDLTSRPQNKVTEPKIIPETFCQNTESRATVSRSLPQVTNYMKITPVALLQTMDFMGIIPAAQQHIIEFRDLTSDSVFPTSKLTPRTTQSDSLITSNYGSTSPSRDIESVGMIPMSSHQSIHSPKVIPVILGSSMDKITIPQSRNVETKDFSPKLTSQDKISLDLTSGSCIQELGSEGITPASYHEGTNSMVLIPRPSHEDMETSRLTSRHKVLEDSEVNTPQSDQVRETMELTPGTCAKRKESIELTQSLHKVMKSLGTIPKPPGQGTELKVMNQKPRHQVTESAAKTTMHQNEKPVPHYKVIESTKLPPELQNYESMKSIDITTGSKYAQHIPTVNSLELASELQQSSVKSADLALVSQSQTGTSIQLASESQQKDVKPTLLSPRPEQQTIKSAELGPVQQLQSNKHIDLTPSSQLKDAEQLNLSIPPVFPDIKSIQLRKRTLQGDTKLKLKQSAPKLSLQDLRSGEMLSPILMTKGAEMPQVAECRRPISETQKQGKKYEELDPGKHVQAVKSMELKSSTTEPEGLTLGHQALESLEMISEPEYQDTKTKLTFDTCQQAKESVGLIQSSLRDIQGPLSQASESTQMDSESLQSTPNMLQSMQSMRDKPVSQYTTQRSPKLVPISEMQDAESEVLIPEPQGMQFVHSNLGPHSEAINYEALVSEPQFQSVKSMPSISKPQSKSIKPEELSLGSFKDDNAFVDLTAPLEEPRRLIPGKELLNIELRKLTMEPQLGAINSVGLTCRLRHQKIAPAELSPEIWPQKEESVISQKVTETAGLLPRSHCQFFSEPATESGNKETEMMRQASEALIQKPADQVTESTKIISGPHLQVTESSETHLELECENTESIELVSFTVENTQETLQIPSYSEKESLKQEMQYENSEPLAQDFKFMKLTYETNSLVVGSTQFIIGPQPYIMELTSGPQLQGVKSRQLDPEAHLQGMKCVNLIQQPDSRVVDSEKVIQKPILKNMTEELSKRAQHQGMKPTQGPSLKTVRFSMLSPSPLLQEERPADLISGPPYHNVQSDEFTLGYPAQDNKVFIPEQGYQSVTPAQQTSEPQPQDRNFNEISSGPCLQNVRFFDLTPEPKHENIKNTPFLIETPFQVIDSVGFVTEAPFQLSQEIPVGDLKSSISIERLPSHSTTSIKLISELQGVKSEDKYLRPRQEDVKFSELTSGPKLQGVKFREGTQGSVFHDVNPMEVTTEFGCQDSKLVKTLPGLQVKKQVGLNTRPWLQDVKFCDPTSGTQPQVTKPSAFNLRPQLQCVKFLASTSEPKAQGVGSIKLTSEPEQEEVRPEMLVSEPLSQGAKHIEDQTSSFKSNISYKLTSEQLKPDVKSAQLTPVPQSPNDYELIRSLLQDFKPSELIPGAQLPDVTSMEWVPVSGLQDLKPEMTTESQMGNEKSVAVTLRHYLRGIKSLMSNQGSQLGSKSAEIISRPQRDVQPVKVTPDSKLQCVKSNERANLDSKTQEYKTLELAPYIQLQDMKIMEQDVKAIEPKLGPKMQDYVPFVPVQLFQAPQLQVGKLGKLTSEPQIPEVKSMDIASQVNLQREKSILETIYSPDAMVQSNSGPKSVKMTSKQKKQDTARKQMLPGIKYVDLPPIQQFQEKAPVNLTPGTEQNVELSAVSPVQQHIHSEQMKRSSKPKYNKCLSLIHQPTIKGRELVSHNRQLKDKKLLEPTSELNTECVKPKEVKVEPQLQSLKPPKLTQGQQLLQVKALEPSSESPPPQSGVPLESEKEPQLENMKCIQWIPQPEFQGGDSIGLNLKSQSQDIESAESKPLIWLRDVKPPKLTLGSKIQDTTYMGPQFQRVKTPELSSGQQLQKRRLLVSFSEPPLQGVKTVELNPELQMRSMESTKWIPLPGFQEMRSLLDFESQSQSIKPTELEHLIQLRNNKSSLLTPRPKLQGTHHSASFQEKLCRKLRSTQSCDLMSQSKPQDIKSILFQPRFPLDDGKFLELIVKPHLQVVNPLQFYPGIQSQVVKTPGCLQSDKAINSHTSPQFKSMTSPKPTTLQQKLEDVKSEVSSEPQWQGLQSLKLPLETKCQDKKCTELKLSSQLQDTPFSKVATGIKSPVVKSTDLNIGLLLQRVKTSEGTSRANLQDVKHKEGKPYIQCQVMESSELIPGPKLQNMKSVINTEAQIQGLKSSKLISDTKFQDAESGKFKSRPQSQDKKSGLTMEPTFQKMKSVDCKSGPQLQGMNFSSLITGIKIHDVKSKKCTADPQVKVVKSSEVVPREKCQSFEIIPSEIPQGVKSLELNPSPKLQDEKSSKLAPGRKFSGVESVGSQSGPQLEKRECSDLIMDIKLKNIKPTDLRSIPQYQGIKSSAVIPGTKTQAEKSMFNSGIQTQSKRFYPLTKLQSKNSTEVNHNPEFQAEKSTKCSLGPRIHSMISSEVNAEKQGQVKKSSQLNPWPELQGVKFMTFNREPQLQHIKSSKLCKETIHQDKKSIKLNPEQQFKSGTYYELLLGPQYRKERFSDLNPGPYTKNELYIQSKHSDEQFQGQKYETKCQGEKSSELNSQFPGINVLAYKIAPLPQGVKSKLTPRPYQQDIKSTMPFPGSHFQAKNSSTPILEPKHQCVNTSECNTGPNKQCHNVSETTANMEMQGIKSSKLNPGTERNLCQSETSTVLGPEPHFPVWKSQLTTESKPLSVIPRKCSLGPQMQCNSPELNPRPNSQGMNSMRWKQQVPLQDIKSFELTLGTKFQDAGCDVNPGLEIQSKKYILSDPESHLQGLKSQLIPDSKPLDRVPRKCTPGPQGPCVISPELLPGTKLQCTNSTGCRHGPPSQSIKCSELTSRTKLQDPGFKVNPGTETESETPVVFHTEPHLQGLKSECISNSNCLPGATNDYNLEPQVQYADFSKLNAGPKVHNEHYTGCKYGPPFQSINFFELASGTKYKDMTSSDLNPKSECEDTKSSILNPLQNLHDIKCKLTPGTNFQELVESDSISQLQGMNSCNSNSGSGYQSINSISFNTRPQMQDPKSYDLNSRPEFQGTTSILLNSGPHLQGVKFSEPTPCTNLSDLLLKNHLGSQQQVTQFVPTSDPQLNAVNLRAFLPESSLEDEISVSMKKEALHCGANSVKLVSDPKKQDMKCEVSSLEPCFQKVESEELNPQPHSQGINSAELLSPFRQHSVRPVVPGLEGNSYVKSPGLKARPQPKELNSKNYCLMHKSTVLGSEPCSQDLKSLKSNLWSQPQSSLGLSSCLGSQYVKSDIFVPQPCFQDVKSVQLTPEAQQQGMNCQELTSGRQGVKSILLAQEPSKKLIPAPILTSVKLSNLSPDSQQQDMTSLELTSHPKLQDIKHAKFPFVFLQETPKSTALATGPQLHRVKFENPTPRMSDQMTDFSELSSRPVHQFVEYAEMSPQPQYQIPQSVNLIPSMYQVTESSEIAQKLAHQNAKTVEKSVGLTPKPIGKVMESSGMPLEIDHHEPEFADLTSRDQCSQSLELTPEKSHQSSETLGLTSQSWPTVKELGELHIKQLKQDAKSKEIIPELKHHLTEPIKLIPEARSQREGFSGMMWEPQSISKATGHAKKSPAPYSQALEPVEIIPEKRPYRQEYVALITKSTSSVAESSEMTQDENVELTSETGPQVERSIKLTGIPQQKVEYSRLGHQVPESVYLTSKQCSQGEESLALPPKETGQCERHGQCGKETSEKWQQGERSKWLTQLEKENMNYSEIAPGELGEMIKFKRISPKPLDQINQPTKTQLQVARSTGVTSAATSKLESVKGTPGPPVEVGKSVTLPPGSFSQMVDYIESISQPQDMKSSEFISGIWQQNKKPKKLISEPTHQIVETIEMAGFQVVKTVLFPGRPFQIVKSEKLIPGPIPQVAEPIGIALSLGPCFDLLTMKHFQESSEPVELTPRPNTEVKSTEFTSKTASPFMKPKGLTHEKKLQTLKSRSEKAGPSQVMESEDLILDQLYLNRESEELPSLGEFEEEKYFPKFLCSSSNSLISSTFKTSSELGCLWDMEMPEVLRSLETKNLDSIMRPLSTHSLAIHNQPLLNIFNIVKNTHCEVLGKDMISKMREQVEELKNSSKSLSQRFPKGWRSPCRTFQKRSGARRSLPCSVLRRQQNVWESHSWRQRLPRKYLSNMLMLGNVLQTNVERKLYSQSQLRERADTHQSIQNVFGVPPELMEFSQSLPEKGQSAISQPSVGKNYIQRNTLFHGTEKRMTLRMWTRQSMSSIIQQYSGARIRIKKISKFSYISQELINHMTGSYNTEAQLPVPLNTCLAKDPVPVEESENSQSEFQHSHRPNYTSQDKTVFSEQSYLLQELQLKIAAKLLRSQVPPNVPPPLTSGLVLKYPLCLKCGRCSGFNCCHKLQASFGPYLLIYPQIHLVRTPEGHGEIRLHLGFRLRTGKRPQVPKYQRRDRPVTPKSSVSLPLKKTKIYTQVSRSPTSTLDLESGSSQSPLQDHIRQRSYSSCDLVEKTDIGEFSHYEVTEVHCLPDTDSESNQDENWAIVRRNKPKHLNKRITKGDRTPSTKFYTKGRESCRELPTHLKRNKSSVSRTTTDLLERQPKKPSQPKLIQLLSQSIKQAFQRAYNIMTSVAEKSEDGTRLDDISVGKSYQPKQKGESLSRDRMSVVKPNQRGSITKQKSPSWDRTEQFVSSQPPKRAQSFQHKLTHLPNSKVPQRSSTHHTRRIRSRQGVVQNDSSTKVWKNYKNETSSYESKNSKMGNTAQAGGRVVHDSSMKGTSSIHPKVKYIQSKNPYHSFGRTQYSASEKSHLGSSQRSRSLSEKSHGSNSEKSHPGPPPRNHPGGSQRSHPSPSERKCRSPSERRCQSSSEKRFQSLSERGHPHLSERKRHRPFDKIHHTPLEKVRLTPKGHHSSSDRSHSVPSEQTHPTPFEKSHPSPPEKRHQSPSGKTHPSPSEKSHPSPSEKYHSRSSGRNQGSPSGKIHPRPQAHPWIHLSHGRFPERRASIHSERDHSSPEEDLKHCSLGERPRHSVVEEDTNNYPKMSSRGHTQNPLNKAHLEARS